MSYEGKIVKEFPPSKFNTRNSEGAFIRMDDDSIAFVYSRYRTGSSDGATCDLAVSYSYDEGETFGESRVILTPEECDAMNLMSVSLFKLNDGSIALYYLKKSKGAQCVPYLRKTKDFKTFSKEIRCISEEGYFVVNNDRVRRLSNGNLIFPAALHLQDTTHGVFDHDSKHLKLKYGIGKVYISKDDGETWEETCELDMPYEYFKTVRDAGLQEPGVIELDDGSIYMYFRCNVGRQLESYSYDGGYTFTTPIPSRFTSPPSPLSTLRLSDGNILIGYNPIPFYPGRYEGEKGHWTGGRNPFVLEIADGNMKTVVPVRAIERDEKSGYCYCAMFETKDGVLLGYCAGGENDADGCLTRLRIRKILKEELYSE